MTAQVLLLMGFQIDTSLDNMNAIPETVFTNKNTFLRIWFNDGVSGEAMIENGQRLTSVPYAYYAHNGVPSGAIIMWSGSIDKIPEGWALCDGNNGTPDLRDRFIRGRWDDTKPRTGGSAAHTHVCESAGEHQHELSFSFAHHGMTDEGAGGRVSGSHQHAYWKTLSPTSSAGNHSHIIESATHLPPYYELAFIMKL